MSISIDGCLPFLCTYGACVLFWVGKNRGVYGIAYVAKLSFLAGIRNLMIMPVGCVFDLSLALCCRWNKVLGPGQG